MAERIGVEDERLVSDIVVVDKEGYIGGRKCPRPYKGERKLIE